MSPSTPPPPRVTAVEPAGPGGERLRVTLEDGTGLEAPQEVVRGAGLRPGERLTPALRSALEEGSLAWGATEAALSLLAHRPRSRSELARRLLRKGFPDAVVDASLDELESRGLVDDAAFARALVRDRVRLTTRGRRRILTELRRKGVERQVARKAVDDVFPEEDASDADRAEQAARAWLRKQGPALHDALVSGGFDPEARRARRRLMGYLARRGFRGSVAHRALEVVVDEAGAAESDGG